MKKNLFLKMLLVLIGVLITSVTTQMWAKTIYFQNSGSWGSVYCYFWGGSSSGNKAWPGNEMTQIGSTQYYKIDVGDHVSCIFNNNDGTQTSGQTVDEGKICYYNSGSPYWNYGSITGYTIYFDIRNVTDWTTPYLRVGRNDHNLAYSLSLVSGTKYLYSVSTPGYDNYSAYTIANNDGWQNSNTIYQPSVTKPNDGHAITKLINYQSECFLENGKYILASTKNKTEDGADYWNVTTQNALPTYTVSYSTSGSGSGTLSVTKYNGSTYDAFSTGGTVNPTQIMKIVATPNSGSALTGLSISGAIRIGETDTYYVTATTTITATFDLAHDVTVSYKCGEMTIANSTTVEHVSEGTTTDVAAPAINDHTFSSWSLGNGITATTSTDATPISIKTKASGSYTLTANYTLISCKAYKMSAGVDGSMSTDLGAMSYDADVDAYYIEVTTDAKPYYFRFHYANGDEYCSDWEDKWEGGYSKGKEITANGSKVDCDNKVVDGVTPGSSWGHKPSMYFNGLSGSTIKIWFDYQNKKTWITEATYTVTLANDGHGTVGAASVTAGKNTLSSEFTASPSDGYEFYNWTVTSGGANITITDASANPTTVKATSTGTVRANFSALSYDVTLNANSGTGDDQTVTATYDSSMPTTLKGSSDPIVAPTRTGYDFAGYFDDPDAGEGTKYYNADLTSARTWNKASTATLYAHWSAKSYTITLSQTGETGYGGSAGTASVSATFDASMPSIASFPTAANGYKFQGYYLESNGGGYQFTEDDGTWKDVASYIVDGNWVNAGTLTLYAYFQKAELVNFTYSPLTVAPGKDMTITPVISPTPTGTTCICWKLFEDISCTKEVPEANYTITSSPSSGASSITLTAPTASGTYYLQGILRTGSVCNAGTELSIYKQECVVESDHKVTVQYVCDNENIASSQEVLVPAGDSVGVKAAVIDGYTFSEWVLTDVIQRAVDAATGDSITIKARYNGTLTAKYVETPRVYFKNTLNWNDVWVTYDAYWDDNTTEASNAGRADGENGLGTGNWGKTYHHMTHIEGTDIWYDDVPSYYTSNAFEHWASNIAFNDVKMGNHGYAGEDKYKHFTDGYVIFRRDFDPYNTMFVPAATNIDVPYKKTESSSTYQSSGVSTYVDYWDDNKQSYTHYFEQGGYWKKYNKTYSGYSLRGTFGGIVDGDTNWNGSEHDLYATNTEDSVFTTSLNLSGGSYNYYFSIYKNTLKNSASAKFTYGTEALTLSGTHTNIRFLSGNNEWRDINGDMTNGSNVNCCLTTATAGVYTFYVTFKKNGTLEVSVEYPDAPGDFQVLYSDNTTSEWFTSDVIESDAQNAKVSFFYRPSNIPVLKWKKSTAIADNGTITWGSDHTFDMSAFSSTLNHDSVYVFYLSNVSNNLQMDSVKAYTGEYYIRTNCANKYKWDRYKDSDHRMSYSEFSEKNSGYTHYFMKYAAAGTDVRFVVANEYSPAISDTLVQMDGDVSADPVYTHVSSSGSLAENANIRFMWNSHTNAVNRAYLAAAKDDGTEFLVMQGVNGKLYDANGYDLVNSADDAEDPGYNHKAPNDAIQFSDIENWVYEANVKAKPGTFIKLYAKYDNGYFYYKGDNSGTFDKDHAFTLLGGSSGDSKWDIRVVYDFKTDRLMSAYVPTTAAVTDTIAINADIMFIRHHQEAPTAITFGESSGKLDEVKTVYGVVRLNRWQISNRQHPEDDNVDHCSTQELINTYHPLVDVGDMTSEYERSFYFISFPFDVNLSEVIGFGTYGVHWGIMYYDGKGRAKNGYWADSEVNWKYFTVEEMRTKKLNAYEGYVIGIDPALMYYSNTNIWTNNCSNLEIFFPSQTSIGAITKKAITVNIDQEGYECKIDRRTDKEKEDGVRDINKNRTIADSYWHCIGVPTYADLTSSIVNVVSDTLSRLEWGNKNLLYVYHWSKIDNSMTAVRAEEYEFETMKSYLVQYAGETISWAAASAGPQPIVARQHEDETHYAEFNLAILQNEEKQDQTFVRLSDDENITNDFDFNYDLGKSFNAGKANIYTLAEGYVQAAANCLPFSDQTTVVPVGVKLATDGTYTFAIPEGTNGVGVVLVDTETGERTNLAFEDYTVDLSAGTFDQRFVLEISPIQQTPTGIDGIDADAHNRKMMVDGVLYIIREGQIFDARGARVK